MGQSTSFLSGVKAELRKQFADAYDALAEITTDEDQLAAALKTMNKKVWELVSTRLKESYKNGQRGGENAPAQPPQSKRTNPFRE